MTKAPIRISISVAIPILIIFPIPICISISSPIPICHPTALSILVRGSLRKQNKPVPRQQQTGPTQLVPGASPRKKSHPHPDPSSRSTTTGRRAPQRISDLRPSHGRESSNGSPVADPPPKPLRSFRAASTAAPRLARFT